MLTETCTVKTMLRSCKQWQRLLEIGLKATLVTFWLCSACVLEIWMRQNFKTMHLFIWQGKFHESTALKSVAWLLLAASGQVYSETAKQNQKKKNEAKKIYSLAGKDTILRSDSMRWAWYGLGSVHLNLQQARKATAVFKKYSLSSS